MPESEAPSPLSNAKKTLYCWQSMQWVRKTTQQMFSANSIILNIDQFRPLLAGYKQINTYYKKGHKPRRMDGWNGVCFAVVPCSQCAFSFSFTLTLVHGLVQIILLLKVVKHDDFHSWKWRNLCLCFILHWRKLGGGQLLTAWFILERCAEPVSFAIKDNIYIHLWRRCNRDSQKDNTKDLQSFDISNVQQHISGTFHKIEK